MIADLKRIKHIQSNKMIFCGTRIKYRKERSRNYKVPFIFYVMS